MQITPLPPTVVTNTLPQDTANKALPQVAAQAAPPVTQKAIDPTTKNQRGSQSRSNGDRAKGGAKNTGRGDTLNVRV